MSDPIETNVGGATVTINSGSAPETPSQQVVRTAGAPIEVKDSLGRVILLKKPSPLANLDFAKAAGAGGLNQLYLLEVAHLKFVAAIDGETVATPATDGELRVLYARLGDEGNEAAQSGIMTYFVPGEGATEAVKNF